MAKQLLKYIKSENLTKLTGAAEASVYYKFIGCQTCNAIEQLIPIIHSIRKYFQ